MKKIEFDDLSEREIEIFNKAKETMKNAYAPYTNFKVGAAVLSKSGNIYSGCNVESVDLTLSTHAEMNAIDTMVAQGGKKIDKIIIVLSSNEEYAVPCGLCRQKILEFSDNDVEIIGINLMKNDDVKNIYRTSLKEVLPYSFGPEYLKGILKNDNAC